MYDERESLKRLSPFPAAAKSLDNAVGHFVEAVNDLALFLLKRFTAIRPGSLLLSAPLTYLTMNKGNSAACLRMIEIKSQRKGRQFAAPICIL
jgi:hypothetical protein